MEDILNKGIQDIKNISLSMKEKKLIFEQVMKTPLASPYAPTRTIWSLLNMHRSFAYALGIFLIFSITGGTLAYAAEGTVPGDLLYPVKVNVTEPIRDVLATTPASKAQWDATKAVRRLNEAETLANKNKLTPEYRAEIEQNFNKNVNAFNKNIQSVATSTRVRNNIDSFFDESINEHANILQKISSHKIGGEQHEIDTLEQAVLHAHQIQSFPMGPNTKDHSFNTASSSKEIIKHPIAPRFSIQNPTHRDGEDIRSTNTIKNVQATSSEDMPDEDR